RAGSPGAGDQRRRPAGAGNGRAEPRRVTIAQSRGNAPATRVRHSGYAGGPVPDRHGTADGRSGAMAANRRISDSMRTSMPANLATWALQLALAIYLGVLSALPMLRGDAYVTETFDRIGFGNWFRHLTGLIELAGAVGLLIPLLCGLAALGLTAVMIGAIVAEFAVRSSPSSRCARPAARSCPP